MNTLHPPAPSAQGDAPPQHSPTKSASPLLPGDAPPQPHEERPAEHEERFSDEAPPLGELHEETPQQEFVRVARQYLGGAAVYAMEKGPRLALERAVSLAENSPTVAAYLAGLGPTVGDALDRCTPDHAARAEELAREERAPGGAVLASEFFAYSWPQPRALVGGWLGEGSLGMLYAYRGRGKTWLAYDLALSVALGSQGGDFLGWPVEGEGRAVLYVDGEMRPGEIRERFSSLLEGRGCGLPAGLRILSRMAGPGEPGALLASLATPEGRAQVERAAKGCALVLLDNARTLGLGGAEENESAQWLAAQEWLLSLKRLGCAVLFVHHAGKGGQQRGTSAREDACDYVLGMHPPELLPGEERTQGARAVLRFEKSRGATLAELGARDARLDDGERGGVVWTWVPVEERQATHQPAKPGERIDRAKLAEYRRLLAEGLTIRAATEAVGVPKTTLIRWNKAVPQEGAPSVPSVGRSLVPCSVPPFRGSEQGTRNSPEPSACSGGPEQHRNTGTHLENSSLEPVSLFRSDHAAEHIREKSASPRHPTPVQGEERFSSPSANTEKSASPQPQPPRAYPRRGGPIPPGLAPVVLFTPKGPGAGGRS